MILEVLVFYFLEIDPVFEHVFCDSTFLLDELEQIVILDRNNSSAFLRYQSQFRL